MRLVVLVAVLILVLGGCTPVALTALFTPGCLSPAAGQPLTLGPDGFTPAGLLAPLSPETRP